MEEFTVDLSLICEQPKLVLHLINQALEDINTKYGPHSNHPLAYHNRDHTYNCLTYGLDIVKLAIERQKLTQHDATLVLLGIAHHDLVHGIAPGVNEEKSIQLTSQRLASTNTFSALDMKRITELIAATVVTFENGGLVQSVKSGDYLASIVADADLSSFGCPPDQFWSQAKQILEESLGIPHFSRLQLKEFIQNELSILRRHQFYTSEANELLPNKPENIEFLLAMFDELQK